MNGRVIFVIIAGIITSVAILQGYPEENTTPQVAQPSQETTQNFGTHDAVFIAMNNVDAMQARQLAKIAAENKVWDLPQTDVHVTRITPENPPTIAGNSPKPPAKATSSLDVLAPVACLKSMQAVVIADIKNGKILEGETSEATKRILQKVRNAAQSPNGSVRLIDEGDRILLASWDCTDDSLEKCLLVNGEKPIPLDDKFKCEAARQTLLVCDNAMPDTARLFTADASCRSPFDRNRVAQILAQSEESSGHFTLDEKSYRFKKATTDSHCALTTVVPEQIVSPQEPPLGLRQYPIFAVLLAIGGGIVVALLGLILTRRRKDDEASVSAKSEEDAKQIGYLKRKLEALNGDLKRAKDDVEAKQKRLNRMDEEADISRQEISQLKEQLDFARSAFKKEQIMRMSLAEENTRLEDAVAAVSPCTVVDSPVNYATANDDSHPQKQARFNTVKPKLNEEKARTATQSENGDNVSTRITKNAESPMNAVQENAPHEDYKNFFDAITDDGWDEIAESFDSIMLPTKTENGDTPKSTFDLLEHDSDLMRSQSSEDSEFGMTNFLNEVKQKRAVSAQSSAPRYDTETHLKPAVEYPKLSPLSKTNTSDKPAPLLTEKRTSSLKSTTLNGVASFSASIQPSILERQIAPSSPDLAMRTPNDKKEDSFKPAPSWSGKSIQDSAVDNHTLYDALKRRAKDVSQMNLPAAPNPSGDFEFNRSLSRSGVFSLTGSRVDIDPLSDNECFKKLYAQYVEAQKQCGENTDKFTLEQFVSRLAREKARLMQNYKCKNVNFSVYIKDGKASLKATPQK